MVETVEFVDAQEMARLHPATFDAPTQEELDGVAPGYFAKVCAGNERFWVIVGKVDGSTVEGVIDNDLVNTDIHGLECGNTIQFEKRHIHAVLGRAS